MPVPLLVETRLDERSATSAADKVQRMFSDAGKTAGRDFSKGLGDGLEKTANTAKDSYDKMRDAAGKLRAEEERLKKLREDGAANDRIVRQAEAVEKSRRAEHRATRDAAAAYNFYEQALRGAADGGSVLSNVMAGISQGAAGTRFGALASQATTLAAGLGEAGGAAVAAGASIAGIAVGVGVAIQSLYDLGARFDAVGDTVAIRTGKMGADLDALNESLRNVSTNTSSSIEDIADIGVSVSKSLGLTGAPLEDLTKRIADLNRMTGESLNVREFGKTLTGFGTGAEQAPQVLNELLTVAQNTNIPLGELVDTLGNLGPAARSLGLDMNETAGLIVAFETAGLDAGKMTQGLTSAAKVFADNNIDLKTGLADTITQIKGFITAGNEAAAIDLAGKVFGERGAQAFVDAIRQGVLNVDTLNTGLDRTGDTITDLNERTSDFAEKWDILKNRAMDFAGVVAGPVFDALNNALGVMVDLTAAPNSAVGSSGPGLTPTLPFTPTPTGALPTRPGPNISMPGDLLGNLLDPTTRTGVPGTPQPAGPPQDVAGALAADAAAGAKPGLPQAPSLPLRYSPLAPGTPGSIVSAQTRLDEAAHDLAEKQARLQQLETSNVATAEDIQKAKNAVTESERNRLQAEQSLQDSKTKLFEQQSKQLKSQATELGQIGASLDQDFGISKGLVGIAENITKFVANLAAAPLLGAMRGRQAASGYSPGETGGGLVGMLSQTGAFGSQYQVQPSWARNQPGSPSALGPAALQPGGYAGDAALLANVPAGRYTQEARGDLTQGLADCSSAVEDLVNLMDGQPTAGAAMNTGNAAEWLTGRGFMPGAGGPGDFRVGFNSGHMQATLPGGTPFNWGSAASAARGGVGGTGASDPAFTSRYYRPASGAGGGAGGGGYVPLTQSELTSPGLTSPQPVGGGTGTGGAFPGLGGPPQAFNSTRTLGIPTPGGGPGTGPTLIGGAAAPVGKGSGFGGASGGLFGLAASAAKSAMAAGGMAGDAMGGGGGGSAGAAIASAAMDIGIQEINRAIGYAGQVAGIGVGGLMETFLPAGASELASNSWITRLAGGLVGARPVLPNLAGGNTAQGLTPEQQAQQQGQAGPLSPEQAAAHQNGQAGQQKAGDTNITVNNQRATEDGTGRDIAYLQQQTNAGPGM